MRISRVSGFMSATVAVAAADGAGPKPGRSRLR
jgi:hypothetical protein